MTKYRVTQYADGKYHTSAVYRFRFMARFVAWLYEGESPLGFVRYRTTITEENE